MHVRNNPRSNSFVDSRDVGPSAIHCSARAPTDGDAERLLGPFHAPRTGSACCTSTHNDASVLQVNVLGAATYLPSTVDHN